MSCAKVRHSSETIPPEVVVSVLARGAEKGDSSTEHTQAKEGEPLP